jgi:PAS domain S-box-containing protein
MPKKTVMKKKAVRKKRSRSQAKPTKKRARRPSGASPGEQESSFLSLLIESLPIVPYTCEAEGDFGATYVAPSIHAVTGYNPEDFTSNSAFWFENLHPDDRERILKSLPRLFETGWHEHQYRFRVADGSYRWFQDLLRLERNADGSPHQIVGAWFDVTERTENELARQASERLYRELVESSLGLICTHDLTGKLLSINPATAKALGYGVEELTGQNLQEVLAPRARRLFSTYLQRIQERGAASGNMQVKTRDGGLRVWSYRNVLQQTEDGTPCVLGHAQDITERWEAEKLKTELLSVVSHELRTPMTSLFGSLGLLKAEFAGTPDGNEGKLLSIAVRNTERLVRLLNDMLDIQKIEAGRMPLNRAECLAARLLREAVEEMKSVAAEEGVQLVVESGQGQFQADSDRLMQVLNNLVSNAIKFSPRGATVWLGAEQKNGAMQFFVRDKGRGIPAEKLSSIFDPFVQVDSSDARQKGGSGLGLAICRKLVELHDGRIWAESKPDEETTFFFTVPV